MAGTMRQRQALADLNDLQKTVVFPAAESSEFQTFRGKLRKLIEANFDHPTDHKLEYSYDEQVFWLEITYGSMLAGPISDNVDEDDKRTGMTLRRLVEIDPKEPLQPQIKMAMEVADKLKQRHILLQLLLNRQLSA